ncbi:MAG: glycerate kinase [Elusimicrobiota bacterium]|jgi:glycerate kinase|nr:glycerate kinase [Elusimicrobiota bacterium]
MKKILLMPNPFKGSLPAGEFCFIAEKILNKKAQIKCLPVADGGDGLIDVFKNIYPQCKEYKAAVIDAVYKKHKAPYIILPDGKTCVLETAKICGLGGLKKKELLPLKATSYGIGQVIKAALKKGAKTFYIGLGGIACNDGGAGIACALGFQLLDKNGKKIKTGAAELLKLTKIKGRAPKGIKFVGLSDVKNPLLGPRGSAKVFGPQKGASQKEVEILENALTHYSKIVKKDLRKNINKPRCGAAGAIGAGIYGFLNAKLIDGGKFIFNKIEAETEIKKSDLIITAEGKLDSQTFYGKAPQLVCALAAKHKKPVVFICGINEIKNKKLLKKRGIIKIIELIRYAKNKQDSIKNAGYYLNRALLDINYKTLEQIVRKKVI